MGINTININGRDYNGCIYTTITGYQRAIKEAEREPRAAAHARFTFDFD
jgi:hypothetical protein